MLKRIEELDLAYILEHTLTMWESLRQQRLFITGGTGFFGCWLLESFLWANKQLALNANAVVLTRDAQAFAKKCPHLAHDPAINLIEGDVRNFNFPEQDFSHVIHAATEANAASNQTYPTLVLDTLIQGTKRTLDFAIHAHAKRFLYISSGAIYGRQPAELTHIPEDYPFEQQQVTNVYAYGKRVAEYMCGLYATEFQLDVKIGRCFAFVGPHLPLTQHFAIGNFIQDGLMQRVIQVNGDGTPYRSYLYAADLMIWLWTILFRGKTMRPYNVGSDESITIKDLAVLVSKHFNTQINILEPAKDALPTRYVPDITRARTELNLNAPIHLNRAIELTKAWYL